MGTTVVLVAVSEAAAKGDTPDCCICGRKVAAKRTAMQLRDGDLLYGTICPECVLRGPKGAARRLRDRLVERMDEAPDPWGRRGGRRIGSLHVLIALKAAALEEAESFPLAARQAAVRELRGKR